MEAANAAIVTVFSNNNNVAAEDARQLKVGKSNKKKVNVLKAALLTLFGRSRKTTKCIQTEVVADANNWAMLVGCVGPKAGSTNMMLMSDDDKNKDEKVLEKAENQIVVKEENEDDGEKLGGSSCSSEWEGDSRYASALNLQELDKSNGSLYEDDNEEELFDDTQGDAMIDMKAEMFIAQFYAQMKMESEHQLSNF